MNIPEIKAAVDAGRQVHWANAGYLVHRDELGQYLITYMPNDSTIGLTDRSGQQLNGEEEDFFISDGGPSEPITCNQNAEDGGDEPSSTNEAGRSELLIC